MRFNKEDFDKFCDILNKLSSITPDVEIVNSKVCQLGADTSYNIYADMSNLIKEPINFGITNLNAKYPILRMMKNTTSEIIVSMISLKEKKCPIWTFWRTDSL